MHHFANDPLGLTGYWSPQTSAANFCELDYAVAHHIAEFVNTLSNAAYVWQAVATLPPRQRGHYGTACWKLWTWPVENIALLLVGLGSAAFHLSLRHGAQIADESGMYALVGAMDYRLWAHGLSGGATAALGTAMLALVGGVVAWNAAGNEDGTSNDLLHFVVFTGLVTALWPKVLLLIREQKAARGVKGKKDEVASAQLRQFTLGAVYFCSGFVIWVIDGVFCDSLRSIRASVGLPLGFLFELHGWWHFLTALGAGRFIWVVRDLTRPGTRIENGSVTK